MIAIRNKIRIITRSRYNAWIYRGKKNGVSLANALRTMRSTFQGWIGFSEGDVKTIARGAESFPLQLTNATRRFKVKNLVLQTWLLDDSFPADVEHHAEARLAAHHAFVSLGCPFKRENFVHRMDCIQRAKVQCVL